MNNLPRNRKTSNQNDNRIVTDGFEGYNKIALKLAWKFYRWFFDTSNDLTQVAAVAALEALDELGEDATLKQVSNSVQRHLRLQAKAYGWTVINYRKPDGKKTAYRGQRVVTMADAEGESESISEPWVKRRVRPEYVGVSPWGKLAIKPIDELLFGKDDGSDEYIED